MIIVKYYYHKENNPKKTHKKNSSETRFFRNSPNLTICLKQVSLKYIRY